MSEANRHEDTPASADEQEVTRTAPEKQQDSRHAQQEPAPPENPAALNTGAVYVLSNQDTGNSVTVFSRAVDGSLIKTGTFPTGGLGVGNSNGVDTAFDPLISQGALTLTEDLRFLLAVDTGSNELSVLAIEGSGLVLRDRVPSGGVFPVSVANHGDLVYVVNQGQSGHQPPNPQGPEATIAGFTLSATGDLTPIPDSIQVLSGGPASGPAEVRFRPDGSQLLVTERLAGVIDVFPVDANGLIGAPVKNPSNGIGPFSITFNTNDVLLITEVTNAVSTYRIGEDGTLTTITQSLPTTELAACWSINSIIDPSVAYVTNGCSGSVSGLRFDENGAITPLTADGHVAVLRDSRGALDMALSRDGRYLYILTAGYDEKLGDPRLPLYVDGFPYGGKMAISAFRVEVRGGLTPIGGYGIADDRPQPIEQIFITGYTPALQPGHQGIAAV
jgi:6-phosphogluconolactonase (cycloisomerase 2 family)